MVEIVIPDTTRERSKAQQLRSKLQAAVDALDAQSAWPTTCGPIEIAILNDAGEKKRPKAAVEVAHIGVLNSAEGRFLKRGIWRKPGTVARILVSVEVLDTGLAEILRPQVREEDLALFLLGHEIHHLTEIERQHSCGISYGEDLSGFAAAARPDFPPDWQAAVVAYAQRYKRKVPDKLQIADAIADEAAADLTGLYWLGQCGRSCETFAEKLIVARADHLQDGRMLRPQRRRYDIHGTLETILAQGRPADLETIWEQCWTLAVESARASGALPRKMETAFAALRALALPRPTQLPAPSATTPKLR